MATAKDLRRLALALEGTSEAPHFDRAAFKVKRIYVTLAADGKSANLKFAPDEQEYKCLLAPEAFSAIPNAWGKQGWTTATLSKLSVPELKVALEIAHAMRMRCRRSGARGDDATPRLPPQPNASVRALGHVMMAQVGSIRVARGGGWGGGPFAFLPAIDRMMEVVEEYGAEEIGIIYDIANAAFIREKFPPRP